MFLLLKVLGFRRLLILWLLRRVWRMWRNRSPSAGKRPRASFASPWGRR
jgi:hypothetical protein